MYPPKLIVSTQAYCLIQLRVDSVMVFTTNCTHVVTSWHQSRKYVRARSWAWHLTTDKLSADYVVVCTGLEPAIRRCMSCSHCLEYHRVTAFVGQGNITHLLMSAITTDISIASSIVLLQSQLWALLCSQTETFSWNPSTPKRLSWRFYGCGGNNEKWSRMFRCSRGLVAQTAVFQPSSGFASRVSFHRFRFPCRFVVTLDLGNWNLIIRALTRT